VSKAHNRNMERKRRQENTSPQKANNNIIEDLMDNVSLPKTTTQLKKEKQRFNGK
jgi:hypothetical protein